MIYFDNAATTPPLPYNECTWGNPSSPHTLGITTERKLQQARRDIANVLSCAPGEITFTSGGTESNNLALIGLALASRRKSMTFVAQPWEHPSILEPLKYIKDQGLANVTIAPYAKWGNYTEDMVVAISQVNHETGDINDVSTIAATLKQNNKNAIVVVDGAQGFCKEALNLSDIDIYTFSGHKCHAPAGIGGLMIRDRLRLVPLLYGGGQENKLRPGTENVQGAVHMANSANILWQGQKANHIHVQRIKETLMELEIELSDVTINSSNAASSPYVLNMSFVGVKSEVLVHMLAEKGVYTSMGAACYSRKNVKTTLEIMGFPLENANSAIRLSFSHLNTVEEATSAKAIIRECVARLRKLK